MNSNDLKLYPNTTAPSTPAYTLYVDSEGNLNFQLPNSAGNTVVGTPGGTWYPTVSSVNGFSTVNALNGYYTVAGGIVTCSANFSISMASGITGGSWQIAIPVNRTGPGTGFSLTCVSSATITTDLGTYGFGASGNNAANTITINGNINAASGITNVEFAFSFQYSLTQ
jgi:hypothetical protein